MSRSDEQFVMTFVEQDGKKYAISTGWDQGKLYKVGDRVEWWARMERPGVGIDGVYVEMGMPETTEDKTVLTRLVVISNGVVAEVGTAERYFGFMYDCDPVDALHSALEQKWPKSSPPRELWGEEIWAAKEKQAKNMKEGKWKGGFRRSEQP